MPDDFKTLAQNTDIYIVSSRSERFPRTTWRKNQYILALQMDKWHNIDTLYTAIAKDVDEDYGCFQALFLGAFFREVDLELVDRSFDIIFISKR